VRRTDPSLPLPLRELRFTYSTSRGPGGQNVNRRQTRAILHWDVGATRALAPEVRERLRARFAHRLDSAGVLHLASERYRDRGRNCADCVEKLRRMLREVALAPRPRRPTRPTRASTERRLRAKHARARRKRERGGAGREELG
jgi:ribosome-associated protein